MISALVQSYSSLTTILLRSALSLRCDRFSITAAALEIYLTVTNLIILTTTLKLD